MPKYTLGGVPTLQRSETDLTSSSEASSGSIIARSLLIIGFSLFYFASVFLRASGKYFWFDELGTVFQSRLPLSGIWMALRAGFDFNPPLLYLLTKIGNSLFGEGLIVTRLPEIIAFWLLCVCLFLFVNRRAGMFAGFIAMVLPMFTGAFYYAYDARPHGVVLGCCGLALITWQMTLEQPRRILWYGLFSASLFAAFMTHCYAITLAAPFGMVELVKRARDRRTDVRRWIALCAPAVVAVAAYLPLLHQYHKNVNSSFLNFSPLEWAQIPAFYTSLLTPCILIVVLVVVLLALRVINALASTHSLHAAAADTPASELLGLEIRLALYLLTLPVLGLLLAFKLHSPYYDRYFMSAVAGVSILVGFGVGLGRGNRWAQTVLAGVTACWLVGSVMQVAWHRLHGWPEKLVEPSSGFSANSSLTGPLANFQLLQAGAKKGERIVVLWPIDYFYLISYAPQFRSQLYYIDWDHHDPFFTIMDRLHAVIPFPYNTVSAHDFYTSRSDFMFFGKFSDQNQLHALEGDFKIKTLNFDEGRFLADVELKPLPTQ